jgi:hypothetical protein
MRPVGEICEAILSAAGRLTQVVDGQRRGATLRELAQDACVGIAAARHAVNNLHRAGKLEQVGTRKVSYRNRPVAEYALRQERKSHQAHADVAAVFSLWRSAAVESGAP